MKFVARDVEGERMEIMEIPGKLIKIIDKVKFHFRLGQTLHQEGNWG